MIQTDFDAAFLRTACLMLGRPVIASDIAALAGVPADIGGIVRGGVLQSGALRLSARTPYHRAVRIVQRSAVGAILENISFAPRAAGLMLYSRCFATQIEASRRLGISAIAAPQEKSAAAGASLALFGFLPPSVMMPLLMSGSASELYRVLCDNYRTTWPLQFSLADASVSLSFWDSYSSKGFQPLGMPAFALPAWQSAYDTYSPGKRNRELLPPEDPQLDEEEKSRAAAVWLQRLASTSSTGETFPQNPIMPNPLGGATNGPAPAIAGEFPSGVWVSPQFQLFMESLADLCIRQSAGEVSPAVFAELFLDDLEGFLGNRDAADFTEWAGDLLRQSVADNDDPRLVAGYLLAAVLADKLTPTPDEEISASIDFADGCLVLNGYPLWLPDAGQAPVIFAAATQPIRRQRSGSWRDSTRDDPHPLAAQIMRRIQLAGLSDADLRGMEMLISRLTPEEAKQLYRDLVRGGPTPASPEEAGRLLAQSARHLTNLAPLGERASLQDRLKESPDSEHRLIGMIKAARIQSRARSQFVQGATSARKNLLAGLNEVATSSQNNQRLKLLALHECSQSITLGLNARREIEKTMPSVRQYLGEILRPAATRGLPIVLHADDSWGAETSKGIDDAIAFAAQIISLRSGESGTLEVSVAKLPPDETRAWMEMSGPATCIMHIADRKSPGTILHLLGHALEFALPGVRQACREFQASIMGGDDYADLSTVSGGAALIGEWGRKGDLDVCLSSPLCYAVGKAYANSQATEVLAIGLESLYNDPVNLTRHPLYFQFLCGLLLGDLRS